MPTDEEIRARRARKAEEWRTRTAPERRKRMIKMGVLSLAAALALGGAVAGYIMLQPEPDVHWHAALHIYVAGERVELSHPEFDLRATGYMRGHLHNVGGGGSESLIHVEGTPGLTIGEFFKRGLYNSRLGSDFIDLNDRAQPSNVTGYQGLPGQLWRQPMGGEWERVRGNPSSYKFQDTENLLLVYGATTPDDLERFQEGFRDDPSAF